MVSEKTKFEGLNLLTYEDVCVTLDLSLIPINLAQILPGQILADHLSFRSDGQVSVHFPFLLLSLINCLWWVPLFTTCYQSFEKTGSVWSFPVSLFPFPICCLVPYLFKVIKLVCSNPWLTYFLILCFFFFLHVHRYIYTHLHIYIYPHLLICPIGWGCRIHQLLLWWGVRHSQLIVLDMTLKLDGELWGMLNTPSLPLLPGPLWLGMVAPDRALSMG